jgi:tetratricopeptide (TPR) repeat protein
MLNRTRVMLAGLLVVALLAAALRAAPTRPEEPLGPTPMELPDLSASVRTELDAEFLKPDERRDLRVRHGQATSEDLDTPARRARWALLSGRFDDPALRDEAAPALDRAEGLLNAGDIDAALKLIEGDNSLRAVRLRVTGLDLLNRSEEALKAAVPALNAVSPGAGQQPRTAAELVEAVRAAAIVTRLRPPGARPGDEHRRLLSALRTARESFDRLDPQVYLAEARLLYEKDSPQDAHTALETALSLNPRLAEGWALLGQMAVNAFDLGSAERIALRLADLGGEASPLAAQVRARAMLRQNDPALAAEGLAPALAAFPKRLDLLDLSAAVTALSFDETATKAALEAYDRLSPGSPRAYFEAGRALGESRQYATSAALLREAMQRAPHWTAPMIELGLLSVQAADDETALEVLQRAAAMDPFNLRAGNSLTLVREMIGYERVETDHFVIRFQPGLDRILAKEMVPVLEQIHAAVTGRERGGLRHEPAAKTFIDLMPNHRWFAVRIAGMPRIHTIAASTGPIIAMETPREGAAHTGTYDWPRVLLHEYVHTVGLSRTKNRIPHWFTEAQAVYLEHGARDYPTAQMLARALIEDELFDFVEINLAFVRPKRPQDRAQAYAQGHWMYEYLVGRFGDEAPLKLMDAYAAGVREEEAYQTVLGVSRAEFFEAFRVWAREQVVAWGLLPRAGMPTMEELLAKKPAAEGGDEGATPAEPDAAWVDEQLKLHPGHPDLLELRATLALAKNNGEPTAEMVPLLEEYAAARPVDPMPHRVLARLYLGMGGDAGAGDEAGGAGVRRAVPHLEFLDAREDKKPTFAAQLAAIYAQMGELDKAGAKAERAVRIAPFDARQRELAAGIALQRGETSEAQRHIEAMVLIEPEQPLHRERLEAVKRR